MKLKKYRKKANAFLIEGVKSVLELLNSDFQIKFIVATEKFISEYQMLVKPKRDLLIEISEKELHALGTLEHNDSVLAVAFMKPNLLPDYFDDDIILALDDVRDPGNFGTIVRTADWYGLNTIIASESSAELYNPKVIAASMGSFTRVNVFYYDLDRILNNLSGYSIYGTFLEGKDIHSLRIQKPAIIVMGNESHGVADQLQSLIQQKISIPRFGKAESLNVAISTGIVLDHFRRTS